ncbi:uncharacterized protein LOC143247623 [Tachypleus tridentatus]|uniref:uncharacterized protein LOC143247623 n=1 Tax=Tachypleus tridentatus TaxID=6853 RepID=UPI003FD42F74
MGTAASLLFRSKRRNVCKLSKKELQELKSSTHYEGKQIRKWYQDFIQDCPDGHMSKEVFRSIYGQFYPTQNASRFVDYMFNVFDANKDGVVTFKEFISAISVSTHGSIDDKLNWAFKLYDLNNDGFVSHMEMLDIVTAIYRLHGKFSNSLDARYAAEQRVNQLFVKLDKDRDGKISCKEFCSGFKADSFIVKALVSDDSVESTSRRPSHVT